jgi:transcriptional antiterminator NusG
MEMNMEGIAMSTNEMSQDEETGTEDATEAVTEQEEEAPPVNENMHWYVVNTYSGYENRAKKSLEERIKQNNLQEQFGEILIPTETVEEMRGGTRRTIKRKFFPGYMVVQMELRDDTWHLVKNTPKISGFVGRSTKPLPISADEVGRLTQQMTEGVVKVAPVVDYEIGEEVRIIDGSFASFSGSIEDVKPEKSKLRVLVSIFGRATPVELDFIQVEKLT